ncbi:MAG: C2 family cysteine protease [Pseudomonadota bacterium]|nr:C2 family cysteine protease [Pseudomonadota bacterium]
MLQRQLQAPVRSRKGGGDTSGAARSDRQSRLGNAAVQERSAASAPAVSEAPQAETAPQTFPDGAELQEAGAQQPLRPAKLSKGQTGALIGTGATVKLTRSADGNGRAAAEVADGSAAEIVSVTGSRIKVKVRDGEKNVEGWVDGAVFSDQPALTRDEDDAKLADDYVYSKVEGDHSPVNPKGKDTAQGAAGNCFLIASMAAVANASPGAIKDMVKYDKGKGTYTVRFYEEQGRGAAKPVYIEVDGYLPTEKANRKDPTYAGDENGVMWSAIIEKAYAKWKGGYDVIGEGGTGEQAMAEITGVRSQDKRPSSMKADEVIPFFTQAQKDGKAIYAGVRDAEKSAVQKPFRGTGDGPFTGSLTHTHRWNEIHPGSVEISDAAGKAGDLYDSGSHGDKTGKLSGTGLRSGIVNYKGDAKDQIELAFAKGKGPAAAGDLEVAFDYEGVLNADKTIIGNHAYAFEAVVGGKELQFYNPWGTYQPKPITPGEFLTYFDSLTTNTPPSAKTQS